jgi:hypothetical protein
MTNNKDIKKATGYIVYEGESQLNGDPIVAIVTLNSVNDKTGNMAQLWILRSDMHPSVAKKTAMDGAICGDCIFRQSLGGACYVTIHQAPAAVYRAYSKGNYPELEDFSILEGRSIRFGAYGDPAAIPVSILATLKRYAKNNTSYTHQWKDNKDNETLKQVSMASVDNLAEAQEASEAGYRWFRVTNDLSTLRSDEIICPNTTKGTQCIDCNLCSGASSKAKSIVIEAHGMQSKRFVEEKLLVKN